MANFKISDAQQTKMSKNFKNDKPKLLTTNAAIWLNKIGRINQLTSKYIQIKMKRNNQ
jgi:hypothetical protein